MELPGLKSFALDQPPNTRSDLIVFQRALERILAFTGHDMDDVVNSPFAKNEVMAYYKLHCQIQRTCEVYELERQWNPVNS